MLSSIVGNMSPLAQFTIVYGGIILLILVATSRQATLNIVFFLETLYEFIIGCQKGFLPPRRESYICRTESQRRRRR